MRRLVLATTVALALSVSASVATVVVANPAWASSSVTCHKLGGHAIGALKFHLKKCTPPNAETTLTGLGTDLTTVGGPTPLTWTWNGGATTIVSLTVARGGVCMAGTTAFTDTGTVTGGTSAYTVIGDSISMVVCKKNVNPYAGRLRLAAGSMALL